MFHHLWLYPSISIYRKTPRTGPGLMQEPVADWPRVDRVLCTKVVLFVSYGLMHQSVLQVTHEARNVRTLATIAIYILRIYSPVPLSSALS